VPKCCELAEVTAALRDREWLIEPPVPGTGAKEEIQRLCETIAFAEERHLDRYVHDDYTKYLGARDVSEATNALKTKRLTFLEKMVPIRRCPPSRRIPPRNWKDGALWAQPWDRARGAE